MTPTPAMTAVELSDLLIRYRVERNSLEQHKAKTFPCGTPVVVSCPRYRGPGIASHSDGCPADQLPVRLPNDNVWWYPLEACSVKPLRKENASGVIDEEELK